jgi:cyclopropane fatty-acyl-phospholipid synthase-like methyltransferase
MDNQRYSSIAHGRLPVWNPINVSHLERFLSDLSLPAGGAVLEIGCGRGYVLGSILSQYAVTAIGVDISPFAIAHARRDAADFLTSGRLSLVETAFEPSDYSAGSFDLVVCIGATHAAGGYQNMIREAKRMLRPAGLLLVGEGYWRRAPAPEYLTFLQMHADDQLTHQATQAAGEAAGFALVMCSECMLSEWDAYEGEYAQNIEDYVRANSADPEAEAMLDRIRAWRDAYFRWGRDTLGFGLYLFRDR